MQPPSQELVATDIHHNTWTFRHVFRGMTANLIAVGQSFVVSSSLNIFAYIYYKRGNGKGLGNTKLFLGCFIAERDVVNFDIIQYLYFFFHISTLILFILKEKSRKIFYISTRLSRILFTHFRSRQQLIMSNVQFKHAKAQLNLKTVWLIYLQDSQKGTC